jgi:hypothetical protein
MRALVLAMMLVAVLAVPSALATDASPSDDEDCGGTVALLCEHYSTPYGATCIVYVRGGCLMWM